MGKILGIDFGMARIGLAISDETQTFALPLPTIKAGRTLQQSIANLIHQLEPRLKEIEQIVIGLPLNMDGSFSNMTKQVQQFGNLLKDAVNSPIYYFDERLSSAGAHSSLKELSFTRKKRAQMKDQVSATFILQSFLDSQKNKKR